MKNKIRFNIKYAMLVTCLCFSFSKSEAQILDVPYRNDLTVCGFWCWAKCCQMVTVYFGNDTHLCDILEVARLQNPGQFGSVNCCDNPLSCCNVINPQRMVPLLENWSIASSWIGRYLSLNEVQNNLSNNRPFIIQVPGHVVVGYGIYESDIYFHDPGNGSQIHDYNNLINGIGYRGAWINTQVLNTSASACLLTQHIPGLLNSAISTYKAINHIVASCTINDNSIVNFKCQGEVTLESGFEIQNGSSLLIETGVEISCP